MSDLLSFGYPDGTFLIEGKWGNIPWQFFTVPYNAKLPPAELCISAYCVVIYQQKVLLVKHRNRSYEFAGGHIHNKQNHKQLLYTLRHEVLIETGAVIHTPQFFGYKKISPAPHCYIPYFYAFTSTIEPQPLEKEVEETNLVPYTEAMKLLKSDQKILKYLYTKKKVFQRKSEQTTLEGKLP